MKHNLSIRFVASLLGVAIAARGEAEPTASASPKAVKSAPAVETAKPDTDALESEVADLEFRLQSAERAARSKATESTDREIAERVVLTETLLAKRRALLVRRSASRPTAERAQHQEFLRKMADAKTPEDRQTLLDRHIALERAQTVEDSAAAARPAPQKSR